MTGIGILEKGLDWNLRMTCACVCVCHISVFFFPMEFFVHKEFCFLCFVPVLPVVFLVVGLAIARLQYPTQVNLLSKAPQQMELLPPLEGGTIQLELFHLFVGQFP